MSRNDYEDHTMLLLGARGVSMGASFVLAERVCLRSSGGGVWNEWRCDFADGRTAYLAEARGELTLYRRAPIVPDAAKLAVGAPLDTGYVVVERDTASRVGLWGDTKSAPDAEPHAYADLSGRDGSRATIDFGDAPPATYVGVRVTFAELALTPSRDRPALFAAPDVAPPHGFEQFLSLGEAGTIEGASFEVLGVVQRSVGDEDERFAWTEYLLWNRDAGFRWLSLADGHWSFVAPIDAGKVQVKDRVATFEGVSYRASSEIVEARVEYAVGDFPWEVRAGDVVNVRDFVHAPALLSSESTHAEITWSRATYFSPQAIVRAFGDRELPKPRGRAPHQPSTSKGRS